MEQDEVSRSADFQTAGGHPDEGGRAEAGQVHRCLQTRAGEPHQIGNPDGQRQGGAGQQLALPGDDQPAVLQNFDRPQTWTPRNDPVAGQPVR